MEIQYFGANCIRIVYKKTGFVIDDNLSELGLNPVTKEGDVFLRTHGEFTPNKKPKLVVDGPGEYEVSDVSVKAIAARAHMDEEGKNAATMFKLDIADVRIAVTGHIYPELTDEQLEEMGTVDMLIVPVGNAGYTLDAIGAGKIIKKFEPKIVIPTHYADKAVKYEVPQTSLEDAIKELPFEMKEKVAKFKVKHSDIPDIPEIVILERQ
ncbi:MAG: MBL fold metallo-hydrolase [Candidatus Saccharibacteria bacterium]|nr:MBL fold metallo-hydrolase [Candidatus Saccharibacteria bacterium]